MKLAFGCDHAGLEGTPPTYKDTILAHLRAAEHEVIDCGTQGAESVDYPDIAGAVCREVLNGKAQAGILLCGTGLGMSMAANRHMGIRAAAVSRKDAAKLAREHNDANVLCLGARILKERSRALGIIDVFLGNDFSAGERHRRRVDKIDAQAKDDGDTPCTA